MVKPLIHKDTSLPIEDLAAEAEKYQNRYPIFKFMWQFIHSARNLGIWNADQELGFLPITDRMQALQERSDIRAKILHEATGIFPNLATAMPTTVQIDLLNSALENNAVSTEKLLAIFEDSAPIVYFDMSLFWQLWKNRWKELEEAQNDILRPFFTDLLRTACDCGWHWNIRMALRHSWHVYIPIEMREKIDLLRLEQERKNPRTSFSSKYELEIITPDIIMQELPFHEFQPVLDMLEKKLGIGESEGINEDLLDELNNNIPPSTPQELPPPEEKIDPTDNKGDSPKE
jgi:hypothetical protein